MAKPARMPTNAEWSETAQRGEAAVRRALKELGLDIAKTKAFQGELHAAAWGALVAIGAYLRGVSSPDGAHEDALKVVEEWSLAYIRGAIRGSDEPLKEDGTIMRQASDP